jgi:hypothetical protein
MLAGGALACLTLVATGAALLGNNRDFGPVPAYVASHKATLKLALVEPPQQAQIEPDVQTAALSPGGRVKLAAKTDSKPGNRFDAVFASLGGEAQSGGEPQLHVSRVVHIPMPHARPKHMLAAIPLPRERVAETAPESAPAVSVAAAEAEPPAATPDPKLASAGEARAARAMTALSYAPPTREQLFAAEVTGSIGNPARDLAATTPAKLAALAPIKPAHDKPAAKPPHKLTIGEKLWGGPVRLASLTPMDTGRQNDGGIPRAPYDRQTAVYVLTDKKVYLPDGSALEAHSGLGDKMDDPRFVKIRMHGATPPHVYDLTMREALFHGVEALRMTPIGGEEAIFGRAGILAHTYMLGPNGQSNGCVSFKDYDAFLDAFKEGKITRLAVIARLD